MYWGLIGSLERRSKINALIGQGQPSHPHRALGEYVSDKAAVADLIAGLPASRVADRGYDAPCHHRSGRSGAHRFPFASQRDKLTRNVLCRQMYTYASRLL